MADHLLTISIDMAERQCKAMFPKFGEFSATRQAELIDWMFNLGIGTVLTFKKALAAILDGDWDLAAAEMQDSLWFSQVGNRGPEIVGMVRTG
ncbi:MAG: lysozyme, partial [Pseudomonadota bacterium]